MLSFKFLNGWKKCSEYKYKLKFIDLEYTYYKVEDPGFLIVHEIEVILFNLGFKFKYIK